MNSDKKIKEIKLSLRKYSVVLSDAEIKELLIDHIRKESVVNDAEIKELLIDHVKKELVLKLKDELNFDVNEVVENMNYKAYEVSVNFLYIDNPKNEEELLDTVKLLIREAFKKLLIWIRYKIKKKEGDKNEWQ